MAGCAPMPATNSCPANLPTFIENSQLSLLPCLATPDYVQAYQPQMEQGLRMAWLALDKDGPNCVQADAFLRPDALLILVFLSDEDDCSIDEQFCSPSYGCDSNADCPVGATCQVDEYFSQMMGKEMKLCCGVTKKDYYNRCSLLGDYKGLEHHNCAYDLNCQDCSSDDDCEYGWYCKQGKKCRPEYYSFTNSASCQNPPGTPIHALAPVDQYFASFALLKANPGMVFVVAVTGDGLAIADNSASLVSQACLDNVVLEGCQVYLQAAQSASPECQNQPKSPGCEDFLAAKKACIADCYMASFGDQSPGGKLTYVCSGDLGTAQLGSRYVQLAQAFGSHGGAASLCSPGAADAAFQAIVEMLTNTVVIVP